MSKQTPSFVEEFIDTVLENEGGYQDSDKDTGNIVKKNGTVVGTNLGITPYTLANYRKVSPDSITVKDMQNLTEEEAREIYLNEYYLKPKLNLIEDLSLQENVFDMAVNSGPSAAIKILQRQAGADPDGILGPNTAKKVKEAGIDSNSYVDGRIDFYKNITANNPDNKKFLKGWINRAEKYRVSPQAKPMESDPIEDAGVRTVNPEEEEGLLDKVMSLFRG